MIAVAAMQYWHVAQILVTQDHGSAAELEAHARVICGLAMSADSDPVMVNSYGPICYSECSLRGRERRLTGSRCTVADEE